MFKLSQETIAIVTVGLALTGLVVHVHATEIAGLAAVEQVAQRDERGGLADPARRVQPEGLLGPRRLAGRDEMPSST